MEKRYLGDSVYAEVDRGALLLTTNNGEEDSNTIYIEPEIIVALLQFIADMRTEA